jgi:hypothetical protein
MAVISARSGAVNAWGSTPSCRDVASAVVRGLHPFSTFPLVELSVPLRHLHLKVIRAVGSDLWPAAQV